MNDDVSYVVFVSDVVFIFPNTRCFPWLACSQFSVSQIDRSISAGTWTKVVFNHHMHSYLRGNNLVKITCTKYLELCTGI